MSKKGTKLQLIKENNITSTKDLLKIPLKLHALFSMITSFTVKKVRVWLYFESLKLRTQILLEWKGAFQRVWWF